MKTKNDDKIKNGEELNKEEGQIEELLNRKMALKKVLNKIISNIDNKKESSDKKKQNK